MERARLIADLVRVVRNVDLAEELAQDALVVALSEWPRIGVPANPGAWLMALAKRRAIDALRRDKNRGTAAPWQSCGGSVTGLRPPWTGKW